VTAPAGDHAGQDRAGAVHQALAVGVDHLVPVVKFGFLGRLEAEREAGVVDEHVDGFELRWQPSDGRRDRTLVPDVKGQRENLGTEFGREVPDPLRPAGGHDDACPVGREPAGHRGTEAAARARDEDRETHGLNPRTLATVPAPRSMWRRHSNHKA